MSKPNFNIIENYSHEHKFPDFKRDYISGMSKVELCQKYDISPSIWREFKDRLPARLHSRNRRPRKSLLSRNRCNDEGYLFKRNYKGNYTIQRLVRYTDKYLSYGTYPTLEVAEKVAEELVECNWDRFKAYDLVQEYAVTNSKRCLSSRLLKREDYLDD